MWIGIAAMAASQVYQGMAAQAQAKSQRNIEEYNARVKELEAKNIERLTTLKQRQMAEAAERRKGIMEAKLGLRGGIGRGPLQLLAREKEESERGILTVGYEGQTGAQRARLQASLHRLYGKAAIEQGKQARTASYFKAAATVISGFGGTGGQTAGAGNNAYGSLAGGGDVGSYNYQSGGPLSYRG